MIREIEVGELQRMLEAEETFELLDVRTPEEWAVARIPGARRFDDETHRHLDSLPRDTTLVFLCHHGVRSRFAASHFAGQGFTDVLNVAGGIEAWSLNIDPTVARY